MYRRPRTIFIQLQPAVECYGPSFTATISTDNISASIPTRPIIYPHKVMTERQTGRQTDRQTDR